MGEVTSAPVPGPSRSSQANALIRRYPVPANWEIDKGLQRDGYEKVCDTLLLRVLDGCQVVGVTAHAPFGSDKSQMAAAIAVGLGLRMEPRVLIVEGDFQSPRVHRNLRVEMPMSAGLSQQLQRTNANGASAWHVVECLPHLDVLCEGVIQSPGAILSQHFEQCVQDLRSQYDIILIDGPPVGSGVEGRAFAEVVDGVVFCARPKEQELPASAQALFRDKRFVLVHPSS